MEKITIAEAMQKLMHKEIYLTELYFYVDGVGYLQTDEMFISGDIVLHNLATDEETEVSGEDYIYLF